MMTAAPGNAEPTIGLNEKRGYRLVATVDFSPLDINGLYEDMARALSPTVSSEWVLLESVSKGQVLARNTNGFSDIRRAWLAVRDAAPVTIEHERACGCVSRIIRKGSAGNGWRLYAKCGKDHVTGKRLEDQAVERDLLEVNAKLSIEEALERLRKRVELIRHGSEHTQHALFSTRGSFVPLRDDELSVIQIDHSRKRRYARVAMFSAEGGRGVYCFVDTHNGNILSPAGWDGPAVNSIRGNVFDDDFDRHFAEHRVASHAEYTTNIENGTRP